LRRRVLWFDFDVDWATTIHILAGALAGALNAYSPIVALQLVLLFIAYQLIEAISNPERDWEDVAEFMVGWLLGLSIVLLP